MATEPLRAALVSCGNRAQMFARFCRARPDLIRIVSVSEPLDDWRENEREATATGAGFFVPFTRCGRFPGIRRTWRRKRRRWGRYP